MFMEMDFPHPRRDGQADTHQAHYAALVASAMARQAVSPTVGAMLSATHDGSGAGDMLDSRIAFFGDSHAVKQARGAFWISSSQKQDAIDQTIELAVNHSGLADSNFEQSSTIKPDLKATERGTEL
jgi:hypothetical protein